MVTGIQLMCDYKGKHIAGMPAAQEAEVRTSLIQVI